MRTTGTVLKKGKLTIPAEIRKQLGLRPGMVVKFELQENNLIIIRPGKIANE